MQLSKDEEHGLWAKADLSTRKLWKYMVKNIEKC